MDVHARHIDVEHILNDFYSSCRDKEDEETVFHLLETWPTICQREREILVHIALKSDLSNINVGSMRCFIVKWFQD